jgi:localization factor PodJL
MNSRVSWSVDGIDPTVRERAEAAARRAGMSLNDWLNSTVGEQAPPNFRNGAPPPASPASDVADIHQRLDSITRQIERISQPTPRNETSREQGVARQLNDAISRLDARLSQISNPQAARQAQNRQQRQNEAVERAASQVYAQAPVQPAYRASPPLSPNSLDFAVAEIAARQSELDAPAPRFTPQRSAPSIAPQMAPPSPAPDFSALERHLFKITSQIEALQARPDVEQSVASFRNELAEIRAAITEAMPRRAIESIEGEIRALSRRIDDSRQSGIDGHVLGNIENALNEIRDVLRSLKSAEQLAGYDEAIRNLGAKLDLILRANDDPGTVRQLESAIAALRGIVSNVASNDALMRLSDDVQMLSSKVDQIARSSGGGDSLAALENRIAALTSALESRERPQHQDNSDQIEGALRALSDRIDRMQVGSDSASAFAHLEQRVSYLLERLEASNDHRASPNLGRVEDGLQDILRHLENQHAALASFTSSQQRGMPDQRDDELIDLVKRELSDIRFSQSKTDRQTQESLETVNATLGHVVDRLALIEGDLRTVRPASQSTAPAPFEPEAASPRVAAAPQFKPELPNPAALQGPAYAAAPPVPHFAAAPREFHAAEPLTPSAITQSAPPATPLAISEILLPGSSPRPALAPDLPPDHPLEPGTRPSGRAASPSERIAASESAISEIPAAPKAPVSSSSFIAAARRAAQAAAAQPPADRTRAAKAEKAKAKEAAKEAAKSGKDGAREPSTVTSKIRSLLVGASVVVIVLGAFKMAMNLLDSGSAPAPQAIEKSAEPSTLTPSDSNAKPPAPAEQSGPSMTSPTPIGRQSLNNSAPSGSDATATVAIPQMPPSSNGIANSDVTGTIPGASSKKSMMVQVPQGERLPDPIGGPNLRAAALRGDASAAYEVGVRFAEGKGVPQNLDEAAKWYDRAAQAGIIPAIFRLGTLYEKGMGVKKDVDTARRYYVQAAERGNAKAMHNLAVLDADGGGNGPNYKSAAQWFRKAADRGVADSQFNLGILYARGIGVEQNLAESFKWFSLAAAQGDADAARKRDDIAKRLDAQSLAAAKLAIQTFTAEPQPDDAINAPTPPGGWDAAATPAPAAAAKPMTKPPATKRAAASTARS